MFRISVFFLWQTMYYEVREFVLKKGSVNSNIYSYICNMSVFIKYKTVEKKIRGRLNTRTINTGVEIRGRILTVHKFTNLLKSVSWLWFTPRGKILNF